LGGGNDKSNIVRLTPEEHYVAHQLLVKMNLGNRKLVHAAFMMTMGRSNNKLYGWLRLANAEAIGKTQKGLKRSEETRDKLSAAKKGNSNALGSKHSKETKAKIGAATKESYSKTPRHHSDETRAKISVAAFGRVASDETIAKMRRRRHSAESIEKMREASLGNSYSKGFKPSEESRAKMSAAQTGRRHSAETLAKMRASGKARFAK
jgi:hypothetical protein